MNIAWKPHTERPEQDLAAVLLAARDDEGAPFLLGIYTYRAVNISEFSPAGWWSEATDKRAPREFFWILEDDLIRSMP